MDYKTYQEKARRTSNTTSKPDAVLNGVMGLIGEAGQVVDVIKKRLFQGMDHQKAVDKLKEQIGDVCWYCAELCDGLSIELDELMISTDSVCIMGASQYQNMPMATAGMKLSTAANITFEHFCNGYILSLDDLNHKLCDIPHILSICTYILDSFCGITLETCMEMNIKKLESRYPTGFDADRSNHRPKEKQ